MTGATFDHRTAGTDESAWQDGRLSRLPTLPTPSSGDHVVVLAAHPDDETLGAGGLIHRARQHGARVTVVIATDGEGSHPSSPTHSPQALATARRREVAEAIAALSDGVDVRSLGLPDGRLGDVPAALLAALRDAVADATLVVTPWAGDRHPDHTAAAVAGAELARQWDVPHWQYPVWMWHWARPDDPAVPWSTLHALPLSTADLAAKSAAQRAHHTQVEPLSDAPGDEVLLPPQILAHFGRRIEVFVVDEPLDPPVDEAPAAATGAAYFDALYRGAADPWGLGSRFYEQRKRANLLAALPRPRFARVFEPGCATGLLTTELAARADRMVAWDVADAAVEQTAARLRADDRDARVRVERGRIPDEWPEGRFDLIVLSEVGYYCPSLDDLARAVEGSLADGGVVVGCHWRHHAADHPHSGDEVHEVLGRHLVAGVAHVEEDFLLHVWGRDGDAVESVARREGIV